MRRIDLRGHSNFLQAVLIVLPRTVSVRRTIRRITMMTTTMLEVCKGRRQEPEFLRIWLQKATVNKFRRL